MQEYFVAPNGQYIVRHLEWLGDNKALQLIIKFEHHPDVGVKRPSIATMLNVVNTRLGNHEGSDVYTALPINIAQVQIAEAPLGHFTFITGDNFVNGIDMVKLKPYFDLEGCHYKEVPFLLVCKDPSLYPDQIAYWKENCVPGSEMDNLLKSIEQKPIEQLSPNATFAKELRAIADKLENGEVGNTDICVVILAENNAIRNWKMSTSSNDLTILGVLEATKQNILNNYKIKTTNN